MCQQKEISKCTMMEGCTCGCCGCGCGPSFRSFYSAKEALERLENYKDQLEKELTGVQECLKELQEK